MINYLQQPALADTHTGIALKELNVNNPRCNRRQTSIPTIAALKELNMRVMESISHKSLYSIPGAYS